MSKNRRAGVLSLKIDSKIYDAKGSFSYNPGQEKREAIVGADRVHGFKSTPQVPFIEGEITDSSELDITALLNLDGVTATLELANGKVFVLRDAWYAGEGTVQTEEGNIQLRLEGMSGEEVR